MDKFDDFLKKVIKAILNDLRMSKENDKKPDNNIPENLKKSGEI